MSKKVGLIVFSLLALSLFAVSLVSAETVLESLLNSFKLGFPASAGGFTDFFAGSSFQGILVFFLVALVVYAVAEFIPFLESKNWIAVVFSLIVAALSTFYLNAQDLNSILVSYSAFGIVITAIIPFFLIAVISKKSHDKGFPLLGKLLWIAFIIVTLIRWLSMDVSQVTGGSLGGLTKWIYPLLVLIALAMLISERWIYFRIFRSVMRGEFDQAKRLNISRLQARLDVAREEAAAATTPTARQAAEARVRSLEQQIRDAS